MIKSFVDLTGEEIQSACLFDKACCSTPTLQTQQTVICDANESDLNDSLGEEMRSKNIIYQALDKLFIKRNDSKSPANPVKNSNSNILIPIILYTKLLNFSFFESFVTQSPKGFLRMLFLCCVNLI